MRQTLMTLMCGSLLVAGCSARPEPSIAPPIAEGTLEAKVTVTSYRTQELTSDLSTISCWVRQAGPEARQDLGRNQLELGSFVFRLSEGTASVRTEALNAAGSSIGRADAIVGIRAGQVTLLRQAIAIGGSDDSFLHPLTPLPI